MKIMKMRITTTMMICGCGEAEVPCSGARMKMTMMDGVSTSGVRIRIR
jgi:hypothetical protein